MKCNTVRIGTECLFAKKSGCSFTNGSCLPVIEKCGECKNTLVIETGVYCKSYMSPAASWSNLTGCGLTTVRVLKVEDTKKLNSIKASKKSVGAKVKKKK